MKFGFLESQKHDKFIFMPKFWVFFLVTWKMIVFLAWVGQGRPPPSWSFSGNRPKNKTRAYFGGGAEFEICEGFSPRQAEQTLSTGLRCSSPLWHRHTQIKATNVEVPPHTSWYTFCDGLLRSCSPGWWWTAASQKKMPLFGKSAKSVLKAHFRIGVKRQRLPEERGLSGLDFGVLKQSPGDMLCCPLSWVVNCNWIELPVENCTPTLTPATLAIRLFRASKMKKAATVSAFWVFFWQAFLTCSMLFSCNGNWCLSSFYKFSNA